MSEMRLSKLRLKFEQELFLRISHLDGAKPTPLFHDLSDWYLVSAAWIRRWDAFLQSFTKAFPPPAEFPGPIDSRDIVLGVNEDPSFISYYGNPFDIVLKPGLKLKRDFYLLDSETWEQLSDIYGFDPLSQIIRYGQKETSCKIYPKELKIRFMALTEARSVISEQKRFLIGEHIYPSDAKLIFSQFKQVELISYLKSPKDIRLSSISEAIFLRLKNDESKGVADFANILENTEIPYLKPVAKAVPRNNLLIIWIGYDQSQQLESNSIASNTLKVRLAPSK